MDAGSGGQSGGDGGITPTPLALPDCLSALLSSCGLATPCVYARNDAGGISNYCFAAGATDAGGGARATITSVPSATNGTGECGNVPFTLATVTKADGSPCYSFETHDWPTPTSRRT